MKRSLHLLSSSLLFSAAAVAFLTTSEGEAHAQATGFAINRFDPSERGSEWFVLDSLDLRGTRPAFGAVVDWAHRPLAIYKQDGSVDKAIVDDQVFLHVGGSFVLASRLRLGVNVPIALYQNGETGTLSNGVTTTTFAPPDSPAFGDIRLGGDLRLLGEYGDLFTLALGAHVFLPTGTRANYTGDETVRLRPRVVGAGDIGPIAYSASVAMQYRPDDRAFGEGKLGSEILFAGAVGLRVADKKLVIGPEVYGSTVFGEAFDKLSSPLEGILGGHYTAGDVRFGLGAGAGLTRGFGSPASRVLGSIEWAPQIEKEPDDRDHDGILDKDDACIDVPGVHTDDPKTNGCPPPSDRDHDGVLDKDDACVDVPGVRTSDPKTNGCPPDRDGDGILDADDACVDVPGVRTSDPKTNGCPPDRDGDGIADRDDACPDTPGVKTADPKTNGCPLDPDRDKDGILNEQDACPDEPGKPDPDPKKNGCPKAFISGGQIKILDQVKFATGSAQIVKAKDSEDVLEAVLKVLKDHPELKKVRVEGHTDNRGSADLNKKLSADRAASVVKWLTAKGVEASRLSSEGFGPDRPIDSNTTDSGRQNNRRVEFHIETSEPKAQ